LHSGICNCEQIFDCIVSIDDPEKRAMFWNHVVLNGKTTTIPGFQSRLKNELKIVLQKLYSADVKTLKHFFLCCLFHNVFYSLYSGGCDHHVFVNAIQPLKICMYFQEWLTLRPYQATLTGLQNVMLPEQVPG
jgi:actin-related protein